MNRRLRLVLKKIQLPWKNLYFSNSICFPLNLSLRRKKKFSWVTFSETIKMIKRTSWLWVSCNLFPFPNSKSNIETKLKVFSQLFPIVGHRGLESKFMETLEGHQLYFKRLTGPVNLSSEISQNKSGLEIFFRIQNQCLKKRPIREEKISKVNFHTFYNSWNGLFRPEMQNK